MRFITALTSIVVLVGCVVENPNKLILEKALVDADSISLLISEFPADSIFSVRERLNAAKDEVQWLGAEVDVEFVRADAPIIGKLSTASRYLKDAPQRLSGLKKESERCIYQINGLIEIIVSGATNDSKGDTINDAYITENTSREIEAVKLLEEAYTETERLFRLGLKADAEHWASIDSLITDKRGEWARSIAEE
ncbi:MAG: hypothetical protein CL847_00190 [Crocinitomicaceae bacterium]|nr:hypothetical protein [Crocinitomicaceae bacterium]